MGLPQFYNDVLKFDLVANGLLNALPWIAMAVFANVSGVLASILQRRGVRTKI